MSGVTADFAPAWYWCDLVDGFEAEAVEAPEWERIPEHKRAMVRARWEAAVAEKLAPMRVKLWGPQIPWFSQQPQYRVTVIGPA